MNREQINSLLLSFHVSLLLYMNVSIVLVLNSPGTSVAVSSILMGSVMLGRAAFVFPLSFLSNLSKKNQSEKIDIKQQVLTNLHFLWNNEWLFICILCIRLQVVIWWAGLMRGAVSMALAYNKVN